MSYFDARLGQRPVLRIKDEEEKTKDMGPRPCFATQTGPRPLTPGDAKSQYPIPLHSAPGTLVSNPTPLCPGDWSIQSPPPVCPLCRGLLVNQDGLYHCQGRCGARWVEASPGHLVDLAALPLGVCACCQPPQALVQSEGGAVCPASGRAYLLLPNGATLPADAAPHGICQCCVPPMPLACRDGHLVCQARPANHYRRADGEVALVPTPRATAPPAETLAAIDAALRRNSAQVTVYGLFDVE